MRIYISGAMTKTRANVSISARIARRSENNEGM